MHIMDEFEKKYENTNLAKNIRNVQLFFIQYSAFDVQIFMQTSTNTLGVDGKSVGRTRVYNMPRIIRCQVCLAAKYRNKVRRRFGREKRRVRKNDDGGIICVVYIIWQTRKIILYFSCSSAILSYIDVVDTSR